MGYGNYSHEAHVRLSKGRTKANRKQVFKQSKCHPAMNPYGVKLRESRDSADHPNSTPVVFALDVSGSMGEIPGQLAAQTLPTFMKTLEDAGVPDPQVLFMAVGQGSNDRAPLQVGQFESTAELMDQWLTRMFLEGRGGGGDESYELAEYFTARHTACDSWDRRKEKGFFFVTGDEPPNRAVFKNEVKGLIGDDLDADLGRSEMFQELCERWEPFFLIPDSGRGVRMKPLWEKVYGNRCVVCATPDDVGYVAAGLVALTVGANLNTVLARFQKTGLPENRVAGVKKALAVYAKSLA
jgi:hypothetical protein